MINHKRPPKGHETGKIITTKSPFGSHADMVVSPDEYHANNSQIYKGRGIHTILLCEVVCKDDRGYYITFRNRLDNGLADPKRYSGR
jgi:hypothetical protein